MSTEMFGLALILPVGVERAAYVVHGTIARDRAFAAAFAHEIDPTGTGEGALDAALVLGNPPRARTSHFETQLRVVRERLRTGATLLVGAETLPERLRGRRGGISARRVLRTASRVFGTAPQRSWQVYPSLTRPTLLSTANAPRVLRTLALEQAGIGRGLARLMVSRGHQRLVGAVSVPALLWEFRR